MWKEEEEEFFLERKKKHVQPIRIVLQFRKSKSKSWGKAEKRKEKGISFRCLLLHFEYNHKVKKLNIVGVHWLDVTCFCVWNEDVYVVVFFLCFFVHFFGCEIWQDLQEKKTIYFTFLPSPLPASSRELAFYSLSHFLHLVFIFHVFFQLFKKKKKRSFPEIFWLFSFLFHSFILSRFTSPLHMISRHSLNPTIESWSFWVYNYFWKMNFILKNFEILFEFDWPRFPCSFSRQPWLTQRKWSFATTVQE